MARLLFTTRIVRLFAYGFLSVVLALYLAKRGLTTAQIGLLFTLTLAGDAGITLWLTTSADRFGRRRSCPGRAADGRRGRRLCLHRQRVFLILAAIIGVISPSGNEIGPFLSDGAGGADADGTRRRGARGLCLVQPGRVVCHGHGRLVRRLAGPGAAGRRSYAACQLPRRAHRLCGDRRHAAAAFFAVVARRGGRRMRPARWQTRARWACTGRGASS